MRNVFFQSHGSFAFFLGEFFENFGCFDDEIGIVGGDAWGLADKGKTFRLGERDHVIESGDSGHERIDVVIAVIALTENA